MTLILALGWLSIVALLLRLFGPIIAEFIGAQIAAFEEKNPKWANRGDEGLAIVKDIGLAVVEEVRGYKFPDNFTDEQRNNALFNEAVSLLAAQASKRDLNVGMNDVRRTIEEAVTAFKQGKRSRRL